MDVGVYNKTGLHHLKEECGTGLPGFEPGLRAPEAPVLSWLDYRPRK